MKMKIGAIFTLVLIAGGLTLAVLAFVKNTTPYVTVSEAKNMEGKRVHVNGVLVKDSVENNVQSKLLTFTLKDDKTGETLNVVHKGFMPDNMEHAPRVVVGGAMTGGHFECTDIQLKCPSKYQGEKTAQGT
jgi:cytochrome c-type biogenesis protein CcmE